LSLTTQTDGETYRNEGVKQYSEKGYSLRKIPIDLYYDIKGWYVYHKDRIGSEKIDSDHMNEADILSLPDDLMNKMDIRIAPIIRDWAKEEVQLSAVYGIRIYRNGSWLKNHGDRPGHILSGILNIDQDVDEHWPLYMEHHDGSAEYHYLQPGDLMLYESQLVHGREIPLKGRHYANIFIHYRPRSWA